MEYCYRLNLPQLDEVLSVTGHNIMSDIILNNISFVKYHPNIIFKTEWLNFKQKCWDKVFFFYRQNTDGRIHLDDVDSNLNVWSINWIYNGTGLLNFWNLIDDESYIKTRDKVMSTVYIQTNMPPDKTYYMIPGAYLVNPSYPHQGVGFGNRLCVSLRCTDSFNMTWNQVINTFKNQIVLN